ncbi:class II aldolase/adducin family protein [Acinetobacter faecalis]|uniref:class II aldolase/adducin family protein n=1 Tax=Acinetobacter faecalis TaxID=2665161 RepID=UPI002A91B738|nr:class II aldolase/adducin family protein [Acinetobacter faecalis]MDY6484285.1 class II aldolase/adducin family protein [Acinetobacter faecalis]
MNLLNSNIGDNIRKYCANIGENPLLVQGAGGNVSWKENNILWVKASGTCLENAEKDDIFIPVDLTHLTSEINNKNYSVTPKVIGDIHLKPSIETLLHALMPHRIVFHLHAVEILAHLIKHNYIDILKHSLSNNLSYAVVDYYKPGEQLASAIGTILENNPTADIVFLQNHGVVIGGDNITNIDKLLNQLTELLVSHPIFQSPKLINTPEAPQDLSNQYSPIVDFELHQLALNPVLSKRLKNEWVLYPDHIVFLGPSPFIFHTWIEAQEKIIYSKSLPELIFIIDQGVFVSTKFTKAQLAQLRCYFDVLIRQSPTTTLNTLNKKQIAELLNWDAEQYRQSLSIL